uniref:C2H2-type domain-containing protein n=1 Tax=Eptatretus burgeri TaxID=7764 RepID=A0A8C4NJQ9_EPTBU
MSVSYEYPSFLILPHFLTFLVHFLAEQRLIKQMVKEEFVFGDDHEWRKRSDEEILPKLGGEMKEQMKLRKCVVLLEKLTQMDKQTQKYPSHLHTKKGSYKCNECGKCFSFRCNLSRHYGIHVLEKPYTCDKCGKKFRRKERLHLHLRIHAGIGPFKCNKCGKAFSAKQHHLVHMRIHAGIRPFKCNECGKAFAAKTHYSLHLRVHSNERPFHCKICGMTFKHNFHALRHRRHLSQCREMTEIQKGVKT